MDMKQYQREYYLKNKEKKKEYYIKNKIEENDKRDYIKSGNYTKDKLNEIKKWNKDYKHPIIDKPTENIIYEDKLYIYLKDKIYSKSQYHYIAIHTKKRYNKLYSIINKNVYNEDIKNMELSKNYVRYYFA